MKSRLMFTLCPSSSFCSVFPPFQFPSKTNFFATLSFLNAFSRLLPHTPLSEKKSPPLKNLIFFLPKNENPLPAFTCSMFIPSCKSSPVPAINSLHPQPLLWQGGGVYGHTSQHARLLQKPAPTLPKLTWKECVQMRLPLWTTWVY